MSTFSDMLGSTTKTLSSLGSMFSKKPESVLGIDIGSSAIKIVELKKERGVIVLDTYGEVALGPYQDTSVGARTQADPDIIAQALLDVIKEAHAKAKTAVVSIQSSASLLFVLDLPAAALQSLDTIIPNEARKYIPVPLSEVSLNYSAVPEHLRHRYEQDAVEGGNEPDARVLVAATRNDAVSGYRNIMAQAALGIAHMEIEVFSSLRSVFHNELTPFALVDIGASGTRVAIVHYGMVMQYDVANHGSSAWTENIARSLNVSFDKAEELKRTIGITGDMSDVVDTLRVGVSQAMSDIQKSINRYEREHSVVVNNMVLVGGGSRMPGLREVFAQSFSIPVTLADPFDKTTTPEFLQPVLESVGPEFSMAVGAALQAFE